MSSPEVSFHTSQNLTWHLEAACKNEPTDVFFQDVGESSQAAKAICATCPVVDDCLEWALKHEKDGIWGGMSPIERNREKGRRQKAARKARGGVAAPRTAKCGTVYHYRKGCRSEACVAAYQAHNAKANARRSA